MSVPDDLWAAWLNAVGAGRPMSAKAQADTLLEVLRAGMEPAWRPTQRRAFLRWCEQEGVKLERE